MFQHAIVRQPSKNLAKGITTASLGKVDYKIAMKQHEAYVYALQNCGLEVRVLDPLEDYPDAVFIEDVCLCTPHCAIITRPGAKSRRGETDSFANILSDYYKNIHSITAAGTVEAGDIMMVGNHYYIGISERTNQIGAQQLIHILEQYGMKGTIVAIGEVLHLKTAVSYLENNCLLLAESMYHNQAFQSFHKIAVNIQESYAANAVWVNGQVLIPSNHCITLNVLKAEGYNPLEIDISEFQKLDGGMSCLSLRF